jgi:hypothetical protein
MNNKIKFLEILLADLVAERDTLELDLNNVLNSTTHPNVKEQKHSFDKVLGEIVNVNNKIKTLSEYLTQVAPTESAIVDENLK